MTSMGDLGREIDDMKNHPQGLHPETELDRLEARLDAFFEWSKNRPHPEIHERFHSEFTVEEPLHDEVVAAISEGRADEVRHRVKAVPSAPDTPS